MADEQTTTTRPETPPADRAQAQPAEPHFPLNGNGKDAHEGKYAPPKGEETPDGVKGDAAPKASPARKLILGLVLAAVVIIGLLWGISYYHYSQNHVGTDDAYITGNLVNVSPIISGTLNQLNVDEGSIVYGPHNGKPGTLIARLEDSGPRAAVAQAQAAYQAALSQVPQAQTNLAYETAATNAAIQRAQAGLTAQQAKTTGAQQQVTLIRQTTQNQVTQAQAQVLQAQAQAAQADAQVQSARATVASQRQAVQTAQRAADAARANIAAAQANAVKATRDEARYAVLVQQQAVTQQQYDAAAATATGTQSQLAAVTDQARQAESAVAQARSNVLQALAQLAAAEKSASAVHQQVNVARAGLGIAYANETQVPVQQSNVLNSLGQGTQAQADLATAQAGTEQIALRRQEIATYRAQAASALAQLHNAQVTLGDCTIYAQNDGTVVRKAANVGASLSPGQSIVTVTQGDYVYVSANFKETQLRDVLPNEPAEVEVDSFPGRIFKGYVNSVNETTGATQALLPPDNATGNFTKVVQRIPVRIELIPAKASDDKKYARAADIHSLRQGMSVTATIDVSQGRRRE